MAELARIGIKRIAVVIPIGWTQVKEGEIEENDMYFNLAINEFEHVDSRDVGDPFDLYAVVIRREKGEISK